MISWLKVEDPVSNNKINTEGGWEHLTTTGRFGVLSVALPVHPEKVVDVRDYSNLLHNHKVSSMPTMTKSSRGEKIVWWRNCITACLALDKNRTKTQASHFWGRNRGVAGNGCLAACILRRSEVETRVRACECTSMGAVGAPVVREVAHFGLPG